MHEEQHQKKHERHYQKETMIVVEILTISNEISSKEKLRSDQHRTITKTISVNEL